MNSVRTGRLHRVVWLASWPKSGNTWLRALLANFLSESDMPVHLEELSNLMPGGHAASRTVFDTMAGIESSHCTDDEAELWRPTVYRLCAEDAAREDVRLLYYKTHEAFVNTASGEPLFPPDVTAGAVYLVRNPLDVVVSFAFHCGHEDMSRSTANIVSPRATTGGAHTTQLRQRMMDWPTNVKSWAEAPFPVLVLRYEDLLADTLDGLTKIVRFLSLDGRDDDSRLRRAVEFSSFSRLAEAEKQHGFRENWGSKQPFFRSGRAGDWRRHLTAPQALTVLESAARTMSAFGYDCEALLDDVHAELRAGDRLPRTRLGC